MPALREGKVRSMKKDLLFQYLDEGTTPVSLPEGLHLEITTPTLRGVLR